MCGSKYAFFPLLDYTGRPDYVADSLLRGRFAVMVDGSPMVLIAPANLMYILKSPEDVHTPYYYVAFERILRLIGLVVSALFPGFWISLSAFNLDQIPYPLVPPSPPPGWDYPCQVRWILLSCCCCSNCSVKRERGCPRW